MEIGRFYAARISIPGFVQSTHSSPKSPLAIPVDQQKFLESGGNKGPTRPVLVIDFVYDKVTVLPCSSFGREGVLSPNFFPGIPKDELKTLWLPIAPLESILHGYAPLRVSPPTPEDTYVSLIAYQVAPEKLFKFTGGNHCVADGSAWNDLLYLVGHTARTRRQYPPPPGSLNLMVDFCPSIKGTPSVARVGPRLLEEDVGLGGHDNTGQHGGNQDMDENGDQEQDTQETQCTEGTEMSDNYGAFFVEDSDSEEVCPPEEWQWDGESWMALI